MLDVLLATRNRPDEFEFCVSNLAEQTYAPYINLYVMDGNSSKKVEQILTYSSFRSTYYYRDEDFPDMEKRWPVIYNFLAKQGKGDFLTYWSDDVWISDTRMFSRAVSVLYSQTIESNAAVAFPYVNLIKGQENVIRYQQIQNLDDSTQTLINYGVIRRLVWQEVGGLDEDFKFYHADCDLSARIVKRGYNILLYPWINSYIYHKDPDLVWKNPDRYLDNEDMARYNQKHPLTKENNGTY